MLKVAMLSGWHVHAHEYAQRLRARADVQLTAVWGEEGGNGEAFAKELNLPYEPCLDTLLARPDVDAVCVNTPTNLHRDVMVKAANAGKHIFTEKVLAPTAAECADIRTAIEKAGVKFCISFPHRTFPRNLFAKQVVSDGLLGDITYMRVRNAHDGAIANWLPAYFYNKEQCGGGAMMDLGAHPMYLTAWLMGKPACISSAFTYVTGREVEDNAVCVMKYPSGAIAVTETGFTSAASPNTLELHGTAGTLTITDDAIRLHSRKLEGGLGGWVTQPRLPKALPDPITQCVEGVLHD